MHNMHEFTLIYYIRVNSRTDTLEAEGHILGTFPKPRVDFTKPYTIHRNSSYDEQRTADMTGRNGFFGCLAIGRKLTRTSWNQPRLFRYRTRPAES